MPPPPPRVAEQGNHTRATKGTEMSEVKEQWKEQGVIVPAAKSSALAVNGSSSVGSYLAQHGVGTGGVFIKFAKDGVYRKQADDAQIPTGTEVAIVYDEIRVGWIKFLEKGQQPERKMGPVFSGFVPSGREELGDLDEAQWEIGLSGKPTDPWQFQVLVPMHDTKNGEMYIFGNRAAEERQVNERIAAAYHNLFEKDYDPTTGVIPIWLPMEFHTSWAAILAEGRRPTVMRNGSGWHVRRAKEAGERTNGENGNGAAHNGANGKDEEPQSAPAVPFVLRSFVPFDPAKLPPRQFLFGKHYQRRTTGGTVAPGGTGKSSLEMVEGVSMATGRNLLGEEPRERVRVWYHNGEDNMDELNRRLAAICQYYDIPLEELPGWFFMTSGNEVPLRVAQGYSNLNIDHQLVKCIIEAIGDNKIDVATFDPLVTLHGVPENDTGKMDTVVRIFAKMADTQNCAIELSHHTRKLLPGSTEDYSVDDMRGAGSLKDAMRAVRMLNFMSKVDAEGVGIAELERTSYFRVDRAKANNSPPAKSATWRKFINVDLPNSDEVGVIIPWEFPTQDGPPSPEKAEAERKAEHVFMELLVRFTLADRVVNDRSGPANAPSLFAKEREAKIAKVGKAALADAMRRLFEAGKIRNEVFGPPSRQGFKLVIV
jgi:RecA-family ATPase